MQNHSDEADAPITYINVIPLVDVVLVLLIVFMLTSSFISSPSVGVSNPKSYTSEATAPGSESLVVTASGELRYKNKKVTEEDLARVLKEDAALHSDLRVVLSADASVPYPRVVEVLDLARRAGVKRLALGVEAR
jgi:biopolymer transport protein ExbD